MPHKHKKHKNHGNIAPAAQPAASSSELPVRNTLQECRERQELELEALRSIYLDDIEVLEVPQLAWKVVDIHSFVDHCSVCVVEPGMSMLTYNESKIRSLPLKYASDQKMV